jgi:hypothetical protein
MLFSGEKSRWPSAWLQKAALTIIIAGLMSDGDTIKKYSADKIALLGLFVLSLVAAKLITASRTTGPLKAGAAAIARIRSEGLQAMLDRQGWEWCLLISNVDNAPLGYNMETFERSDDAQWPIKSNVTALLGGAQRHMAIFQCDNSLDNYRLEAQTLGPTTSTEVIVSQGGTVTITRSGSNTPIMYRPQAGAVPEYLIERLAIEGTRGSDKKIAFNVVRLDGTEEMALITTKAVGATAKTLDGGRIVGVYFPEKGDSYQILVDNADNIVQLVFERDITLIFEPTTREEIARIFGERVNGASRPTRAPSPHTI